MEKEIVNTSAISPSLVLSHANRFGNLVYVSGRTGLAPKTGELGLDIKTQTRNCFEQIKLILEESGTSIDQVLSNTCYLANREDFALFNEAYLEYFPTDRPSRTTIRVDLIRERALIEITSVACIST